MLEAILNNIRDLNNDDFNNLLRSLPQEELRRRNAELEEKGKVELINDLRAEGQIEAPTSTTIDDLQEDAPVDNIPAWANPGNIHGKMYIFGDVVKHNDKVYVSTHPGLNHWEPAATGIDERIWREVPIKEVENAPEQPEVPEAPEQPEAPDGKEWKAGQSYKKGEVVVYNGKRYELVQDHTAADHWRPGSAGLESIYKAL